MKLRIFTLIAAAFLTGVASVSAQTSWLDRPLGRNWNTGNGVVPTAPRTDTVGAACRESIRTPETLADRAVTRAGWSLIGPSQSYGRVTVLTATAGTDASCRPMGYNAFVFVNNRFAGTLAPTAVNSQTDGALGDVRLVTPTEIVADFARYTSNDALCCPSQTSTVRYAVPAGTRSIVQAENVDTRAACPPGVSTQDNVITGTVTYRQRAALPSSAVLTVRLVDVSRQDISSVAVAEERIELRGRQVPIEFDLVYPQQSIQERNRYAIRAEITDGAQLLYTTNQVVPVLTQGNPRTVELVLVPVGRGAVNRGSGIIRGTVSYRDRLPLPAGAEARIWLVDSADPNGAAVAETTVPLNRQLATPFELRYEPREVVRQRNYEVRAELRTGDAVRLETAAGVPVDLRGTAPVTGVDLVLVTADNTRDVVTGQTLSLQKFGTGSLQIQGRSSELLVRATVSVRPDGTADVTVYRLLGGITFAGRLVGFDANTLRIALTNSGDADAGGEIEVRYTGRSLNSITSTNLTVDGQAAEIRF